MDFFDQKTNGTRDDAGSINLEKFCIVYLAYFDEARGHQLLLVHPPELKNDDEFLKAESKTVFIHSIWWMSVELQAELSHVDLEFGGRNYLAKKFHAPSNRAKKRSGMDEQTPETVVLILSIPVNLNPFGGEIVDKLFASLTKKHINEFSAAIEKSICDAKIIKSPHDKEVCLRGTEILNSMTRTIHEVLKEYAAQLDVNPSSADEKRKALAYLLYQDIKKKNGAPVEVETFFENGKAPVIVDIGSALHRKVKLIDSVYNKAESKINVTLVNSANDPLSNCVVSIAYVEDFFEKYFYDVPIEMWFEGEELNFQFDCIGKKHREEYIVTVKQDGRMVFQEKLQTAKMRVG